MGVMGVSAAFFFLCESGFMLYLAARGMREKSRKQGGEEGEYVRLCTIQKTHLLL